MWIFKLFLRVVGWVGGLVLKMKLMLTQRSTKLELKLKLSLAKMWVTIVTRNMLGHWTNVTVTVLHAEVGSRNLLLRVGPNLKSNKPYRKCYQLSNSWK